MHRNTSRPIVKGIILLVLVLFVTLLISGSTYFWQQKWGQKIKGTCEFSEFARQQQKDYFLSGMYPPFITKNEDNLKTFHEYFNNFSDLLPKNAEEFAERLAIKTPVNIRPLNELIENLKKEKLSEITFESGEKFTINSMDSPEQLASIENSKVILAVGGPPALITAVNYLDNNKVIYLNDERRWPIANGSAWHIEEDADAEAPTSFTPIRFMKDQISRALFDRVSYEEIEKTGLFPWRTLDWFSFIKEPNTWLPAFKILSDFQLKTMEDPKVRQKELDTIASISKENEKSYATLNTKLEDKLFLPGQGSIIVARNESELNDLNTQQKNLEKENRALQILSKEELINRYGFSFNGIAFGEKTHDKVITPEYKKILTQYIKQHGGTVINGTLTTVYVDNNQSGGIAQWKSSDGKNHYSRFSKILLSLGNQQIYDFQNDPVFNIVGATGSSGLALVYTPHDYKLPRVTVMGGTNHVPVLAGPIPVSYQGEPKNLYLIRFTAGAAITPSYRGKKGAFHDITISLGLLNSIYKTLGDKIIVKPMTIYGCNRMISKNGQTAWIEPYKGIYIQYGAGGGGLTRAPDFLVNNP